MIIAEFTYDVYTSFIDYVISKHPMNVWRRGEVCDKYVCDDEAWRLHIYSIVIGDINRCAIGLSSNAFMIMTRYTNFVFQIVNNAFDDSYSLMVSINCCIDTRYLVKKEDMPAFIYDLVFASSKNDCIRWTYKNKPKIVKSHYGSQLFDIDIVYVDT